MTDKTDIELMQQSLEVLVQHVEHYDYEQFTSMCELEPAKDLILALRERLAKPDSLQRFTDVQQEIEAALAPEQKPVAWLSTDSIGERYLPTPPQKREWQGLTENEMKKLADTHLKYQPESYEVSGVFDLIRAVEAKLKETNT